MERTMTLFLCFLFAMDDAGIVKFEGTEVFQPLQQNEVQVSPEGQVYILNFTDAVIHHYNDRGEKIGTIGAKGKGPGEFTYATYFRLLNGELLVFDMLTSQMSVFDLDGTYKDRFGLPDRHLALERAHNGWVYGNWAKFGLEGKATLVWSDKQFKETRTLMEIAEKGEGKGLWVMTNDGKTVAKFSPLKTHPILKTSPDAKKIYLTDNQKFRIYIFDEKGKMTLCEREEPQIPFDTEWADDELAKRKENNPNLSKINTQYPEFFPVIRDLNLDPDGNLVIDRWRGKPNDNHYPIAVDESGKEVPMAFSWEVLERMVGFSEGHLFLTTLDEESEEAGVAMVPPLKSK